MLQGRTIRVPQDYPTIAEAFEAAEPGDMVMNMSISNAHPWLGNLREHARMLEGLIDIPHVGIICSPYCQLCNEAVESKNRYTLTKQGLQ